MSARTRNPSVLGPTAPAARDKRTDAVDREYHVGAAERLGPPSASSRPSGGGSITTAHENRSYYVVHMSVHVAYGPFRSSMNCVISKFFLVAVFKKLALHNYDDYYDLHHHTFEASFIKTVGTN